MYVEIAAEIFFPMQTEYLALLKKYQELKEDKIDELEAVFSEQAKKVRSCTGV